MLIVRDAVGRYWWMMALRNISNWIQYWRLDIAYLTCSDTKFVVPAASSHFPRNSSPKNGFKGFFSEPNLSLLLLYDDFNVLRNHFNTSKALFAGSCSEAGATKTDGCSVQYAENSVRDVVPRMNGGAVIDERSPLKDAIDWIYYQQGSEACFWGDCVLSRTWTTSLCFEVQCHHLHLWKS